MAAQLLSLVREDDISLGVGVQPHKLQKLAHHSGLLQLAFKAYHELLLL